jgi:hypothetical protein
LSNLPNRLERRNLQSQVASDIVRLQSSRFSVVVEALRERWQRDMPDILFTDDHVNTLLVALETAILKLPGWTPQTLGWNTKEKDPALPLPILGLEYTLSLYGLDRSIRFPAVTVLDLRGWSLTGARSSISQEAYSG